jgi:hypothetical protein
MVNFTRLSQLLKYGVFLILVFAILQDQTYVKAYHNHQSGVTFSTTTIDNDFPKLISFRCNVESDVPIIAAQFLIHLRNNPSVTYMSLDNVSGTKTTLEYTWDTINSTAFPGTPIFFSWLVSLENGDKVQSETTLTNYDDIRFTWKSKEKGMLSVWWHDRDDRFGEYVFTVSSDSIERLHELFDVDLDYPIRIIIYNTAEEFAAWNRYPYDWMEGEASPPLEITAQIVPERADYDSLLQAIIPHELSHLYFFQATHHPLSEPPDWLNEGIAQYNELGDKSVILRRTQEALLAGNYLPLGTLSKYFHSKEVDKVYLAYNESLSAVTYLISTFGIEGLSRLLAAYKKGHNTGDAFPMALGLTHQEFETAWMEQLGIPMRMYPTPIGIPTTHALPELLTQQADQVPSRQVQKTPTSEPTSTPEAPNQSVMRPIYVIFSLIYLMGCFCMILGGFLIFLIIFRKQKGNKPEQYLRLKK